MKWMHRPPLMGMRIGMLGVFLLTPKACAGPAKVYKYKYSDVDIPVSLAAGTVRTPKFPVVSEWYVIMIQVEKPLPFLQMQCMMGAASGPLELKDCISNDPLLRADWTVREGDRVVSTGSSTASGHGMFTDKHIFKFLGGFPGEADKQYVVEVKFTKDGTPLNVANPHLIIVRQRYH